MERAPADRRVARQEESCADVNIIDFDNLNVRLPEMVNDLPAGGARLSGNGLDSLVSAFCFRWSRICLITTGSSIQAITFMAPPHSLQVSMSIWNTRLSRCAHFIDARRPAGVGGSSDTLTFLLPLPLMAGVTRARCLLLGANTP